MEERVSVAVDFNAEIAECDAELARATGLEAEISTLRVFGAAARHASVEHVDGSVASSSGEHPHDQHTDDPDRIGVVGGSDGDGGFEAAMRAAREAADAEHAQEQLWRSAEEDKLRQSRATTAAVAVGTTAAGLVATGAKGTLAAAMARVSSVVVRPQRASSATSLQIGNSNHLADIDTNGTALKSNGEYPRQHQLDHIDHDDDTGVAEGELDREADVLAMAIEEAHRERQREREEIIKRESLRLSAFEAATASAIAERELRQSRAAVTIQSGWRGSLARRSAAELRRQRDALAERRRRAEEARLREEARRLAEQERLQREFEAQVAADAKYVFFWIVVSQFLSVCVCMCVCVCVCVCVVRA